MKATRSLLAVALFAVAGTAMAQSPTETLAPVNASAAVNQCLQPYSASHATCAELEQLLARNFTPRELEVIRTWQATHVEFLFSQVYALQERYRALLQDRVAHVDAPSLDRRVASR